MQHLFSMCNMLQLFLVHKYESIRKELLVHAQEELQHAITLSEQIDFLGGTPSVDVAPRETSSDNIEMLKQDLKL